VRQRLIQEIQQRARKEDASSFLMSFFAMDPDWTKLGLTADIAALPAVMWKMRNLDILRERVRTKFDRQLAELKQVLRPSSKVGGRTGDPGPAHG
jgi:hypothetical protein